MTTHRGTRCWHCRTYYYYQASGHGCNDPLNDPHYCPKCKPHQIRALKEAFRDVRVRFECRYVEVQDSKRFHDVTREQIEAWQADLEERRKTQIVAERVGFPLFDLRTGDHSSTRYVRATSGPHEGTTFRVTSWKLRPDYTIEIGLEWDLVNECWGGVWRD